MRIANLSSSDPRRRFADIVTNIDAILTYTAGLDEQSYLDNQLIIDATERCLSRISEAAVKLGAQAVEMAPDQPWPQIRGIGNWLRHEYDEISRVGLWRIVSNDLPALRAAAVAAIAGLDRSAPPSAPGGSS